MILPLLKPVTVTVVVVRTIDIFNDFTHPLFYLPGRENVTVQLTLYNFQSQFQSQMNLPFMNILLITIPPLLVFIFFNLQIVAGMTSDAVKGSASCPVSDSRTCARALAGSVFFKEVVTGIRFQAARFSGPAMVPPPPASWGSASAAPWPLRSGLSQTVPMGVQSRV